MDAKRSTVDIMKKQREVSPALRERVKRFAAIRKAILGALAAGPLTIPEIAGKTGLSLDEATWHLMTLRKFGSVETDRSDDNDEYYYYRIKE
jgi:DNA-binding transcriptional ArsR family regulator